MDLLNLAKRNERQTRRKFEYIPSLLLSLLQEMITQTLSKHTEHPRSSPFRC